MPSTRKQMRAAGRELRNRREGKVKQEDIVGRGTRPFGAASDETLRSYAQNPKPREQREAANNELLMRSTGASKTAKPTRAFGKASNVDVKFFANATDDEIRAMNDKRQVKN